MTVVVQEVVVQPASATVTLGDSLQLRAVVQDDRGEVLGGAIPDWASSDETVAAVDSTGMLWGLRAGTVDISASYRSVTDTARITVTPPPVYGFVVLETEGSTVVREDDGVDELTVVLLTQPTEDVLIEMASADPDEVVVDGGTLAFTPADWSTPQTVTVRGVADGFVDGDQVTDVDVSVAPGSDPQFSGLPPRVVRATTLDAEEAGITVTETGGFTRVDEGGLTDTLLVVLDARPQSDVVVSLGSDDPGEVVVDSDTLRFTPMDWDVGRRVGVSGVDDGEPDGDQRTLVTVEVEAESSDELWRALPPQSVEVETVDGVLGVKIVETDDGTVVDESGTEDTFFVVLRSQPSSDVVLELRNPDESEVRLDPDQLKFGVSDWDEPQAVRVRGVDDEAVDGAQVTPVAVAVLPGSDPTWVGQDPVEVLVTTTDDDVAGVEIDETGGSTVVDEGGDTDEIRVELSGRPLTDVVLTASSADIGEVQVEPQALTFTPDDWNDEQTFTVVGVDDAELDGSTFTVVTIAVDPASDPAFTGLTPQRVTVENEDDEEEHFEIRETGGTTIVTEGGSWDTFDVTLLYRPTSRVTILATSLDESEVVVSPSSITIGRGDEWKAPLRFTVTGVDDSVPDGDQISLILLQVDAPNDPQYADALDRTVEVTTIDDEPDPVGPDSDGR